MKAVAVFLGILVITLGPVALSQMSKDEEVRSPQIVVEVSDSPTPEATEPTPSPTAQPVPSRTRSPRPATTGGPLPGTPDAGGNTGGGGANPCDGRNCFPSRGPEPTRSKR